MTAKIVIASARRLIDVRHFWCSSSRMAEISVPAWPMPIHQTKLVMAKPQADRDVDAPDADARRRAGKSTATEKTQQQHDADAEAQPASPARSAASSTMALILSVIERKLWPAGT